MAKSNYAVDVKTLFDQGKNTKAKVLDDLTDKLAAHTKLANQFMENTKHLATAFEQYAEHFKESEPVLSGHFATTAEWQKSIMDMMSGFNQACVLWQADIKTYVDGDYQLAKKNRKSV